MPSWHQESPGKQGVWLAAWRRGPRPGRARPVPGGPGRTSSQKHGHVTAPNKPTAGGSNVLIQRHGYICHASQDGSSSPDTNVIYNQGTSCVIYNTIVPVKPYPVDIRRQGAQTGTREHLAGAFGSAFYSQCFRAPSRSRRICRPLRLTVPLAPTNQQYYCLLLRTA